MLTQLDVDQIKKEIDDNGFAYIYYIAHMVETREGVIDENQYKSVNRFKVLKVRVVSIENAYFEYIRYKTNPDNYTTEEEIEVYEKDREFIHYYTVPKDIITNKAFNPRIPSIIYGYTRKDVTTDTYFNEPSPIKPVYTNTLEFCGEIVEGFTDKVSWKYVNGDGLLQSDGVKFSYITSDWYILDIDNFPRSEKALVKVNDLTCYFMNPEDALSHLEQLEA